MKKVLGIFLFSTILTFNLNATESQIAKAVEDEAFESCVSIANRISGGNSTIFRAAYVGCMNGRMDK